MSAKPFFYQETQGIRISVRPLYLEEQSQPILHRYVFAYFIRIENVSQRTVQLLTRHWYIHDEIGEDSEVAGDGVVGEQPTLPVEAAAIAHQRAIGADHPVTGNDD